MTKVSKLNRMIRFGDLPDYVGLRRTRIKEMIRAGCFPIGIKLTDGGRAVAWLEDDLVKWQQERAAKSNSSAA